MDYFNAIDIFLLSILGFLHLIFQFVLYLPNQENSDKVRVGGLLIVGFPHAALMLYILYIILKKTKVLHCLKKKYQCMLSMFCLNKHPLVEANSDRDGHDTDSLPDRLVNPNEYEPLIPAVNHQGTENDSDTAQTRVTPMNTYGIVG